MTPLSIARLPAGSPLWIYALVTAALILHIAAGSAAIVTGYVAIFASKGGRLHRRAGILFVLAMVTMGCAAIFLALRIPQRGNVAGGLLAAYLVATGWMTVRRQAGRTGRFEIGALLLVLALAGAMAAFGLKAQASPSHRLDGYPPALYFNVVVIALLFAAGDLRMILRGGVAGVQRLSRHILRMGFAFFVAAGSFFLGQQKVMPAAFHGSPVLLVLGLAPLGLMLFWLVRVRIGPRKRRAAALAPAAS
jgi:uncharacterized membrane protein